MGEYVPNIFCPGCIHTKHGTAGCSDIDWTSLRRCTCMGKGPRPGRFSDLVKADRIAHERWLAERKAT